MAPSADMTHGRTQIEPGWHSWMSYLTHDPPGKDPLMNRAVRAWEPQEHSPNKTASRSAYKPYSTYVSGKRGRREEMPSTDQRDRVKPKYSAWVPQAQARQ